jgi:lysophospholipid acyltransferase (LPLAT)-like uncharacterized protein
VALSVSRRLQASLIAFVAYPLLAILCRTYRWRVTGAEHYEAVVAGGRQPILALWHGRILPGLHFFRDRGIVVITSQNFDGEWIARILHKFGFGTARGSSSRGGARALVQLRRDLAVGRPAAFTVDGPRGPAGVVQPGVVFLAGATGQPVLPYHIESDRHWSLKSWDRTQIPKPFATVALVVGEPMDIADTRQETLDLGRVALQSRLAALEREAASLIAGPAPAHGGAPNR